MIDRNQAASRFARTIVLAIGSLLLSGCSTLGLSLYPANSALTKDAEAVLDASRVPSTLPRENAKSVLPSHALEPGDSILIEPVNLDRDLRLPADQVVLADGTVDLGPYGRTIVAGRDLEEAESLIEQQIAYQIRLQDGASNIASKQASGQTEKNAFDSTSSPEDIDLIAVNVRMLEPVHRFYVLGEVNAPGSYPLSGYETVLDAIVMAGGLTSSSNPCKILLARPTDPCECRVTLPVCYREIVQLGNTSSNYQLQPGDRVFVSSRSCMDELMFWRASQTCERCAGCNRACKTPPAITMHPMAGVADTMISPGSLRWQRLADDPVDSNGMVEPNAHGRGYQDSTLKEYLDANAESGMPTTAPLSDVDGELSFPSLAQ